MHVPVASSRVAWLRLATISLMLATVPFLEWERFAVSKSFEASSPLRPFCFSGEGLRGRGRRESEGGSYGGVEELTS